MEWFMYISLTNTMSSDRLVRTPIDPAATTYMIREILIKLNLTQLHTHVEFMAVIYNSNSIAHRKFCVIFSSSGLLGI